MMDDMYNELGAIPGVTTANGQPVAGAAPSQTASATPSIPAMATTTGGNTTLSTPFGQFPQAVLQAAGIIKNAWWRRYSDRAQVEALCTFFIITADTAYTSSTANDPSAIQLWGCQGKKRMYLLDEVHGWWEFPELVKQISAFWARNPKAKRLYIENKASGPSLGQTLRKSVPASSGKVVLWKPKDYLYPEDKVGRMNEWARQVHAGLVWVPSDDPEDASYQPWVIPFVDEHDAFTADDTHAHDDRCDAATMANSVWVSMGGGIPRPQYNAGQEPHT
jgi:predicted phage terminase large subunit-like protein